MPSNSLSLGSVHNYNGQGHNINQGDGVQNNNTADGNFFNVAGNYISNAAASNAHRTLWEAIAGVEASHRANQQFERGRCLEGTREEVLRIIHEWRGEREQDFPICWLSGAAGVGKTAIAMTIAKSCEGRGLLSSFFLFRNDPKRDNPSALMLTIAHDLTVAIPALRNPINRRVSDDPRILNGESMEDQFGQLVLKPFLYWRWGRVVRGVAAYLLLATREPNLIIIDGLDECKDIEKQQRILTTIADSYRQHPSSPLRFLICSRSESWIRRAFLGQQLRSITKNIVLDRGTHSPAKDIEQYLIHEFQEIRQSLECADVQFPDPWPSKDDFEFLIQRSDGQFAYVKTVVKFVKLRQSNPITQLSTIIDNSPNRPSLQSPFLELDCLHQTVLQSNTDDSKDRTLAILAAIVVLPLHLKFYPSPAFIELLFGLSSVDVTVALEAMHSVLDIRGREDGIRVYHTPFIDYLFDQTRSRNFYINKAAEHHSLAPASWEWDRGSRWDWDKAFRNMVLWLESSKDSVDPDIIKRFKEPKYLHLEIPANITCNQDTGDSQDHVERMIDLVVLSTVWLEWFQSPSLECVAQRQLGFPKTSRVPSLRTTSCSCPDPAASPAWHFSPCRFDQRAYYVACLRTAQMIILELPSLDLGGEFEGKRLADFKRTIQTLLNSSPSRGYPFEPELFSVYEALFKFVGQFDVNTPSKIEIEWLKWLKTCPYGYATSAEALKQQINVAYKLPAAAHVTLWDAIAGVGASHRAEQQYERGDCLEETREQVLRGIHEWRVARAQGPPICWLSGPAGAGKTSIAMTVAKSCEDEGLVGSFFCFRSDPRRNNPSALFLTIAHELTVTIPSLRNPINRRVLDDPQILNESIEIQFRELILKPSLDRGWWRRIQDVAAYLSLTTRATREPNLVIIDGLDECGNEQTQLRILEVITDSYRQYPRFPLRFLITSRPEAWIREAFNAQPLRDITETIALDDNLSILRDIRRYLLHEFQGIRESSEYAHIRFPEEWPSKADLAWLARQSGGQFIYVATACKFVKLLGRDPVDQLRIIIANTPEDHPWPRSPYLGLDCLYKIVLLNDTDPSAAHAILAAIVVLPLSLELRSSPEFLGLLFGLAPEEVHLALHAMHPVLHIQGPQDAIRIHHTSFTDYLFDQARSREFYIDQSAQHYSLARRWLQALARSKMGDYRPELLDDLRNLDISALFFCNTVTARQEQDRVPPQDPHAAFEEMALWLESSPDLVDPDLIERFRERPEFFHLELPSGTPPQIANPHEIKQMIDWAVLRTTWSEWLRPDSALPPRKFDVPPLRITGCYCPEDSSRYHPGHRAYHAACLRTAEMVVSKFVNAESRKLNIKIRNLLYSTPSQGHPFEPELLSQIETLLGHVQQSSVDLGLAPSEHCTEWLEWLEMCPRRYARRVEALKTRVISLFRELPIE
ncbi:hypothetical protein V5O48_010696 [Marasmius crinis-equi]|uniref:Nephrocystin 3-like N-terminal domain-containing protein n=1 Tax=Marasmius crinis-equi TaxID=585013 RepID=A0ABR3F890_9AGAR